MNDELFELLEEVFPSNKSLTMNGVLTVDEFWELLECMSDNQFWTFVLTRLTTSH